MPRISFSDYSVECKEGANLRRVLLDAKLPLYNGVAKTIHCRGVGTCGTCAIEIEDDCSRKVAVGLSALPDWIRLKARLSM